MRGFAFDVLFAADICAEASLGAKYDGAACITLSVKCLCEDVMVSIKKQEAGSSRNMIF